MCAKLQKPQATPTQSLVVRTVSVCVGGLTLRRHPLIRRGSLQIEVGINTKIFGKTLITNESSRIFRCSMY
jgi:hypothetical protein